MNDTANPDTQPSPRGGNGRTLLLVVAVFTAPIVIAWLFACGILDWRGQGMVNQGLLLQPPIQLAVSDPERDDSWTYPGNWRVVLISDGECGEDCRALAARIATVYQLVGQRQQRVDLVHLRAAAAAASTPERFVDAALPPEAFGAAVAEVRRQHQLAAPFAGLMDSRGYLMMVYPADAEEGRILEDLKRVLRATESG